MENRLTQFKELSFKILANDKYKFDIVNGVATNAQIEKIKQQVNEEKNKLDQFYLNRSKCDNYTGIQQAINVYSDLRKTIKKEYGGQFPTNAWLKYYEMYSSVAPIAKDVQGQFKAFCCGEFPGASICALNHFMHSQRPGVKWDWRGSSILLGEDMDLVKTGQILGDVYGIYKHNREKWVMGPSNNGDATVIENLLDFKTTIHDKWCNGRGVDLYSHDAAIGVEDDSGEVSFNLQEIINAKIHLGCAMAGLFTLAKGGTFIAKQFTFFEPVTFSLIILYATLFDEFFIHKPLTSKPYNSEIYLIGKGFRGLPVETFNLLKNKLEKWDSRPVIDIKTITSKTWNELITAAQGIYGQQVHVLRGVIAIYKKYCEPGVDIRRMSREMWIEKQTIAKNWIQRCKITKLSSADYLPSD